MNNELESIIDDNLKNKQALDLAVDYLDTASFLASSDRDKAVYVLFSHDGLADVVDNLMNLSNSINEVDARLSDLMEETDND